MEEWEYNAYYALLACTTTALVFFLGKIINIPCQVDVLLYITNYVLHLHVKSVINVILHHRVYAAGKSYFILFHEVRFI